jgi:hypothetical protein
MMIIMMILIGISWHFAMRGKDALKTPAPRAEVEQSGKLDFYGERSPHPSFVLNLAIGILLMVFVPPNPRTSTILIHEIGGAFLIAWGLAGWAIRAATQVSISDTEVVIRMPPARLRTVRFEKLKSIKGGYDSGMVLDDGRLGKARIIPVFRNSNVVFAVIRYRWEKWKNQTAPVGD